MGENGKRKGSRIGRAIARLLCVIGAAFALLTVAGFGSSLWWPLELMCHFRMQYLLALSLVSLGLLLIERTGAGAVFALFCGINVAVVAPLYVPRSAPTVKGPHLRAMVMNVLTSNYSVDEARAVIARHNPDFLLLMETDAWWLSNLKGLRGQYPYSLERPRSDNFGIAFLSKVPFTHARVAHLGEQRIVPFVVVRLEFERRPFTILGTHTLPPVGPRGRALRNRQLASVGEYVRQVSTPVLLLGDLNVTRWSHAFTELLDTGELEDSACGFGYQPTWPTHNAFARIPIDHCLYSHGIEIVGRRVGRDFGSDHYPLIVDFVVTDH